MTYEPSDEDTGVGPAQARSGAFVLRAWRDDSRLRARVRSTLDLAADEATEVIDLHGSPESIAAEAVALLGRWLEDFGRDVPMTHR